jgi:hypothetical protein
MDNSKPVYKTRSARQWFEEVTGRAACLIGMGVAIYNFNENPVVISIFIAVLLFVLLFTGPKIILIYPDRFVIQYDAPLRRFWWTSTYSFEGVKEFTSDLGKIWIDYENGEFSEVDLGTRAFRYDSKTEVMEVLNHTLSVYKQSTNRVSPLPSKK